MLHTEHLQFLHLRSTIVQSGAVARGGCLSCSPDSSLHFHSFTCQDRMEDDFMVKGQKSLCFYATHTFAVLVRHAPPQVHNVLLGQTEFVL